MNRKLILGITIAGSTLLLEGQADYFRKQGYSVYLLCPKEQKAIDFCRREQCTLLPVDIARNISPLKDIITLFALIKILRSVRPDILNVGTPKMGLLGSIAGFITGVPFRLYTCRGLRYEHEKGLFRLLLKNIERVASALAHRVVCVGPMLRDVAVRDGVFNQKKTTVIGKGASNGVNIGRFSTDKIDQVAREALIRELRIEGKTIYGFVGRLIDRKGVSELYEAFDRLYKVHNDSILIMLGRVNPEQLRDPDIVERIEKHPGIMYVDFQENVPLYMSIFDVLVQPSWWEGFSNALIQAAAMGVPVITTHGTGCADAVSDGYNALVVPVNESNKLYNALLTYHENPKLRHEHGHNGMNWAKHFTNEVVWEGLNDLYEEGRR